MRIGLFGGSFDPIHQGHLLPVAEAQVSMRLDKVVFLPTAMPPHKAGRVMASPWARFAMVELALLRIEGCVTSSYEVTPGTSAFTVNTVEYFRRLEPEAEIFLILGADSLASFHQWRRWQRILELAELIVLRRRGWTIENLPEGFPDDLLRAVTGERVHFVDHQPLAISSTDLRRRLAAGDSLLDGTVPDLVLQYIHKYALYR